MENETKKKYIISTGIGLQDVDKLKNSQYFISESNRYINGEIELEELEKSISSYYQTRKVFSVRSDEADFVSIRIAKLISEDSFTFSIGQLKKIHYELFNGIYENAGKLRSYNFSKKEWVLDGASVIYGDYRDLEDTLEYDLHLERNFKYKGKSIDKTIEHLARFIANLWQIHPFEEGNTRTIAVFFIKYLRMLGFDVSNETFAKHSWYFRNSLVRANYTNIQKEIFVRDQYLIKFLRNLILGEKNVLANRTLHISNDHLIKSEDREEFIVELMKDNPKITTNELSIETGYSLRTIKTSIKKLILENRISRINGKKYGYWKVE